MLEGGEVNGFPNKRKFASLSAYYTYNFTQPTCPLSSTIYPRVTPDARAREGTRFKSSTSGTQYLVEKVGTSYYKRSIFYNALVFYGINATLRTWSNAEVNGYANLDHVHPVKSLWTVVWNKSLVTNDLGVYVDYTREDPGSWDVQIGTAEGAWNARPINPDFWNDTAAPADVTVKFDDLAPGVGGYVIVCVAQPCDDDGDFVNPPANGTVFAAQVWLDRFIAPQSPLVAHELGHVLLSAHDGLDPDDEDADDLPELDNQCGPPRVPQTIMDYDCYDSFGVTGPVNWDDCGVNHKHGGGSGGC